MEKIYQLIEYCNCRLSSDKSLAQGDMTVNSSTIINHPASLDYIQCKTLDDDDDPSPDSTFDSLTKKQVSEETSYIAKCLKCDSKMKLVGLDCGHLICEICLELKFTLHSSQKPQEPLQCQCGHLIASCLFKNLIKPSKLIKYLNETCQTLKSFSLCKVCGAQHQGSCIDHYKSSHDPTCMSCNDPEEFLLTCGHGYCSPCIKKHAESCLKSNFYGVVTCKDCEKSDIVIPIWIINKVFGKFESFVELQQSFKPRKARIETKSCMICLKALDKHTFITLDCDDKYCKSCICEYFEMKINKFSQDCEILCPRCRIPVDPLVVQGNVGAELCEKYLEALVKFNKYRRSEKSKIVWCVHSKFSEGGQCDKCLGKEVSISLSNSNKKVNVSVIDLNENPFELSSSTIGVIKLC